MQPDNPKLTLIAGAAWSVSTRWSIKALGFLNTVIMARLLAPADYGVVAMAMLVVGLIQAFMDVGATVALLRKDVVTRDEIDSAWTLRVMQSLVVCGLLVLISPVAAIYFEEPQVRAVLWALSICVVLEGAGNIGLVLAQKAFQFSLDFRVNVIGKIISVLATLAAGYLLRDYRALVIGIISGYSMGFLLSYLMHPYRPRWNVTKIGEIWAVTKWLMLASMGAFLMRRGDELIAARIGNPQLYGAYYVGGDLGRLPVGELGPSLLKAFLPVLSSIKEDASRTNRAVLKAFSAANTITLPIGFGLAAIADPLTLRILGDQWHEAIPFVAGFAIVSSVQFCMNPLNTLLVLQGHTKSQTTVVWVELVIFLLAAVLLLPHLHLVGLIWARLLAMTASAAVTGAYVQVLCGVRWREILQAVWRPLIGSGGMYLAVHYVVELMPPGVLQLAIAVAAGVVAFSVWTLISWWAVGRPEGLESTVMDTIQAMQIKAK